MSGSWYIEVGKRRWHWNKDPTFRCPNAEAWTSVDGIVRRERQITAAAAELGADPALLAAILTHRHRSGGGIREKVDGRYTGRCRHCGARLIRVGYRAWVDDAIPKAKMTPEERRRASQSVMFGGGPPRRAVGEGRYFDTKKQAQQWAHTESQNARTRP